ncbi:MAG: c-type cytochrome biogenesis protein CcmF, partial [Enterobacteriaceae bacterium]|nr:c-type cytochrome biogenesis protein CcmF [Enterobacteriaceae bacterium]
MIPELGLISVLMSLFFNFFQCVFIFYIILSNKFELILNIKRLLLGQLIFIFLGIFAIIISFLNDDFTVLYVYSNSNSNLPLIYKFSALWASHEGSFL